MTPEEIRQVVEDYRKSSKSIYEEPVFNMDAFINKVRNIRVNEKDKYKPNGAQGAQGAQSENKTDKDKDKNNDNVGAQGAQGTQGGDKTDKNKNNDNVTPPPGPQGAQGAQGTQGGNNDNVTPPPGPQGAQGGTENKVKNDGGLNLKDMEKYSNPNRKEITMKDFQSKPKEVKTNEVKPNVNDKLLSTHIPVVSKTKLGSTVRPVTPGSARDKAIAKNEVIHGSDNIVKKREMNADFQRYKSGEITKMDFMKQYPSSQTTKKYNLDQINKGKQPIKSHYEPYDLVLNYVLSEGHADSVEEAHYVMMQMDEETIKEFIKKAALIGTGGVLAYKGLKKAGDIFNNYLNNLRNNSKLGGNKRVDDVRKNSDDPDVGQKINFGR